jgi:hypothetical protein
MMRSLSLSGVWIVVAARIALGAAPGPNFTDGDPELVAAAERARHDSAIFWTGEPLPGRWSSPCPVDWQPAAHSGGGQTRFRFDRGEVSGWRMQIAGRRDAVLADVIPHEVDHMVRASLVRRPIPRWLDEGCAGLMESPASHRQLREQLPAHLNVPLTCRFLDELDYPASSADTGRLYSVGFSLVEFLLTRGEPSQLLKFQQDVRPPSTKLANYYGLSVTELDSAWRTWAVTRQTAGVDCREVHCLRHGGLLLPSPFSGLPQLTIYSSEWCGPCREFWSDFRSDAEFRAALEGAFRVTTIDVDRQPLVARQWQIDGVPTFAALGTRVVGYEGRQWLLAQLKIVRPTSPTAAGAPGGAAAPAAVVAAPRTESPSTGHDDASPTPFVSAVGSSTPAAEAGSGLLRRGAEIAVGVATQRWPWLELITLAGGSAATGGIGAVLIVAALGLLRRRVRRKLDAASKKSTSENAEGGGAVPRAPFPRQLDEARQLLELRQSEGRVAVLDALRGMFLEDELQKSLATAPPAEAAALAKLRTALDARLQEVAPLTTRLNDE